MIYRHKLTGHRMMLKKNFNSVSSFFALDSNGNKMKNGKNTKGEPDYKVLICSMNNVKEL